MLPTIFKFDPPREASVFSPTLEEFEDPLKYINKIRPYGQITGICKIIPPQGWKVPFVLDMEQFKFTPRIQRINKLEVQTKIKLNFIDQLTKFFSLREQTFQVPVIENQTLDLYTLHKFVRDDGGHDNVTKMKKWPDISQKMGFTSNQTPSLLRTYYDDLISPFINLRTKDERKIHYMKKQRQKTDEKTEAGIPSLRFAQAESKYTLTMFKEMADKFKTVYFKTNPKDVPNSVVENEFWRIVSSMEASVTVEYGTDLHVIDHGSGFPIKNKPTSVKMDQDVFNYYAESAWNLNNLPVLKESVLQHISSDISGMKIPWLYAGMCFATFCWHIEDHWSYSINYLHMGESKTWYGVPGSSAEHFETAMRQEALESDILDQLVTIMNPNDIMKSGVPVYRTDQEAGEFVITFPRAYHAGFNQGFNFAEACNFAPYDWLHIGRECISHYSSLKRLCLFSHDELVCKIAEVYFELDNKMLLLTYKDMKTLVRSEHTKRQHILQNGISNAFRVKFNECPDDERQCFVCKTTCFLSAIICKCTPSKRVCLVHYQHLCACPYSKYYLTYHYTMDELKTSLSVMKKKAVYFDKCKEICTTKLLAKQKNWIEKSKQVLGRRCELNVIEELFKTSKQFVDSKPIAQKRKLIEDKLANVHAWQNELNAALKPPLIDLSILRGLLSNSNKFINIILPENEKLASIVMMGTEIDSELQSLMNGDTHLHYDDVLKFWDTAKNVLVISPNLNKFKHKMLNTNWWLLKTKGLFLRQRSPMDLMNCLWPRRFITRSRLLRYPKSVPYSQIEGQLDYTKKITKTLFSKCYKLQLSSLYELRSHNLLRTHKTQNSPCPCGKMLNDTLLECTICLCTYHNQCFIFTENNSQPTLYKYYSKLMCSFCLRTTRPQLTEVQQLMTEKSLPIKVPECLVLEYLLSKIDKWRRRAQRVLTLNEAMTVLSQIESNNSKLLKSQEFMNIADSQRNKKELTPVMKINIVRVIHGMKDFKHPKINHALKSELILLMIEGDTLEVTLQEMHHIWMILKATELSEYLLLQSQ